MQESNPPDTLVIGDSILAWHQFGRNSVADVIAQETGRTVLSRAKSGARVSISSPDKVAEGFDIRAQYRPGDWDWVIINGGVNDLISECGCRQCDGTLNKLIDHKARSGEIFTLVSEVQRDARRVLLLGYYRSWLGATLFEGCVDVIEELNARLELLARYSNGQVHYLSAGDVIDPFERAHFYVDRIHPSRLGARLIGEHIVAEMTRIDAGS